MAVIQPEFSRIREIAPTFSKWCAWRLVEQAKGKPAKVPYGNGKALSTISPEDWLSFDDAHKLYERGGFDGVGVLMPGAAGVVGVDIDNCLDETGAVVAEMAGVVETVTQWGSYVEVSPSGTGLRAFIKGVKLEDAKQKVTFAGRSIEVYSDEETRYLTITGHEFGEGGRGIELRQTQLEDFLNELGFMPTGAQLAPDGAGLAWQARSDEEVLKLLGTHNKRGRVTRLLAGDMDDHGGDHSAADFALLGEIAYFTRDPDQIDRLFRQSGLMRPKWEEMRGRETYGAGTIRRALKAQPRGFDDDQRRKASDKQAGAAQAVALKAKGADLLLGGLEGLTDAKGRLRRDLHTVGELLLRDKSLIGFVFYDQFRGQPQKTRPLSDALGKSAPNQIGDLVDDDLIALAAYLGKVWGLDLKVQQIKEAVTLWARALSRNPITERLDELEAAWDGKPRLGSWLLDYCRADTRGANGKDITGYVEAVGARWLIQMVARAYQPGCQADSMLVMEGRTGARKSTAARVLCEAIDPTAFLEGFNLDGQPGKDTYQKLEGVLIAEWGEIAGLTRHETAKVKQFITQKTDTYRKAYDRLDTKYKRTATFLASTNEATYLRDLTGNRRIWPVKVGLIDIERLREDAGQIIGEAVARYKAGARYWIAENSVEDAELQGMTLAEQAARLIPDAWDDLAMDISEVLCRGALAVGIEQERLGVNAGASMNDLMEAAGLEGVRTDTGGARSQRFANALKKVGWVGYTSGGRTKWKLPAEVAEQIKRAWR